MAYVTDTRTGGFSIFARIAEWRDTAAKSRAQREKYLETKKELNRLSRRELADIGITVGDIERIALEAAKG
ncbi:DUF1127 domain-containing protein [Pseudooctadecabacter jejudonensis]|uniref:YjiS-like domain-containing protein n=1 Tax=Pseudooctadecabacter jejudonensis TaxID=1391910 RepID=A0A1Y5RQ68_9RHOB|nr:DUF1127 domain-containing protein [Pseudooctadecabacter jejudonensis]SLN20049.1 hypothetical protein PSJ8397_00738 [Pseudooctadecabacter jejudonensis]